MTSYYNEFDPKAAAWLRELIADGLIASGDVDERSIVDVAASDLKGYSQHHFFAGIGGWSYALRLAGWPDDRPVWTASLPCQPFSAAGKGLGKQDERHLLPHFISLVAQCRPTVLFGEQVSAAIKHGWLDDLYTEMEANNYAVGSIIIGAHSIGAAHIRQRLYWVANSQSERIGGACPSGNGEARSITNTGRHENRESAESFSGSTVSRLGISNGSGSQQRIEAAEATRYWCSSESAGDANGMADSLSQQREQQSNERSTRLLGTSIQSEECVSDICTTSDGRMGDAEHHGRIASEKCGGTLPASKERGQERADIPGESKRASRPVSATNLSVCEKQQGIDLLYCRDNKYRPIESGLKPLVDGVPRGMVHSSDPRNTQEARVMRLKGYGNAIVPTLAAEFISAFMDVTQPPPQTSR